MTYWLVIRLRLGRLIVASQSPNPRSKRVFSSCQCASLPSLLALVSVRLFVAAGPWPRSIARSGRETKLALSPLQKKKSYQRSLMRSGPGDAGRWFLLPHQFHREAAEWLCPEGGRVIVRVRHQFLSNLSAPACIMWARGGETETQSQRRPQRRIREDGSCKVRKSESRVRGMTEKACSIYALLLPCFAKVQRLQAVGTPEIDRLAGTLMCVHVEARAIGDQQQAIVPIQDKEVLAGAMTGARDAKK